MRTIAALTAICAVTHAGSSFERGHGAIDDAVRTLGADAINTLQFTASGATFSVGQNFSPTDPWPRVTVKRYTALIDYGAARMRQELVREMGTMMPRGGGVPFTGELRQIQYSDAHSAWNIPVPANPSAGSLPLAPCTPAEDGGTAAQSAPAPDSQVPCALMLWATPQGFLKAAGANHATITPTHEGTAVSFVIAVPRAGGDCASHDSSRSTCDVKEAAEDPNSGRRRHPDRRCADREAVHDDGIRPRDRHADGISATGRGRCRSRCVYAARRSSTPLIAPKVPYAAALYDNVQRLHLDVQTIVPFHGARTVDLAEVKRQAGR
jgi:hypothetical protein